MRKLLTLSILLFSFAQVFSQDINYHSDLVTKYEIESKSTEKERDISINDKEITITNFLNGGVEDLVLNIDRIEKKDTYIYSGEHNWYYCTSLDGDEYIVINKVKQYMTFHLNLYRKLDEVNFIRYTLSGLKD